MREASGPRILGSLESFEEFYATEYPAVVGLAYALPGNRWVAEDLAQEAFLAAHRKWDRIAAYEQLGVPSAESEHMPVYLWTFFRVLSSWVHQWRLRPRQVRLPLRNIADTSTSLSRATRPCFGAHR